MKLELIEVFRENGNKYLKYYREKESCATYGLCEIWHDNTTNSLNSKYTCISKGIHGVYKSYHPNGALRTLAFFTAGKRNGLCQEWYPNGNMKSMCYYLDDKITKMSMFNIKGDLLTSKTHINGKPRPSRVAAKGGYKIICH